MMFTMKRGKKYMTNTSIKTDEIRCPYCNGSVKFDGFSRNGNSSQVCEYCGNTIYFSDGIARTEHTFREVNEARILEAANERMRIQIEQERLRREYESEEKNAFKNGKLSKVVIVSFAISLFFSLVAFDYTGGGYILQRFSAVSMTLLFAASWLTGMNYVKTKIPNIHVILAMIGFLMLIPFGMSL